MPVQTAPGRRDSVAAGEAHDTVARLAGLEDAVRGSSHQIANDLTLAMGLIELVLVEDELPSRVRASLGESHRTLEHCADVSARLLTLGRTRALVDGVRA